MADTEPQSPVATKPPASPSQASPTETEIEKGVQPAGATAAGKPRLSLSQRQESRVSRASTTRYGLSGGPGSLSGRSGRIGSASGSQPPPSGWGRVKKLVRRYGEAQSINSCVFVPELLKCHLHPHRPPGSTSHSPTLAHVQNLPATVSPSHR